VAEDLVEVVEDIGFGSGLVIVRERTLPLELTFGKVGASDRFVPFESKLNCEIIDG